MAQRVQQRIHSTNWSRSQIPQGELESQIRQAQREHLIMGGLIGGQQPAPHLRESQEMGVESNIEEEEKVSERFLGLNNSQGGDDLSGDITDLDDSQEEIIRFEEGQHLQRGEYFSSGDQDERMQIRIAIERSLNEGGLLNDDAYDEEADDLDQEIGFQEESPQGINESGVDEDRLN